MTEEQIPRQPSIPGMTRPITSDDPGETGPWGSVQAPRAPGGGRVLLPDETFPNEPIPPRREPTPPLWPGITQPVAESRGRIPVVRPEWPPIQMVQRASREDSIGCALLGGLAAVALIGLCAGGGYAFSRWYDALQQPLIITTATPRPSLATPTIPSAPTATPGNTEACVVTPVFNQAPNGGPVSFTVKPGHTEVGGLWWKDEPKNGLPWGNAEVGIDIAGGNQGITVTTNGNAGGSLWDYSAGCSGATIQAAQAKYDAGREAVTDFAGDESLQNLEDAGAVSVQQDPQASLKDLNPEYASLMHARIQARREARLAQESTALARVKEFLGA